MSKFKVTSKPVVEKPPLTREQFAAGAAMVQSQTGGRPLKPIRINFDLDPEIHRRLKMRAVSRGVSVAQIVRQLIDDDLLKTCD
jgi:hypothetical protein